MKGGQVQPEGVHASVPGTCNVYLTWRGGIKVAEGVKVADRLTARQDCPRVSGVPR